VAAQTSKPVIVAALVLGTWFVTFWFHSPHEQSAPITVGSAPREADGSLKRDRPNASADFFPPLAATSSNSEPAANDPEADASTEVATAPGAPVRSRPLVVPPTFTSYTVQRGDVSFDAIAKRLGGGAKLAEGIKRANPFVTPTKLRVGKTILRIPADPTNTQGKLESTTGAPAADTHLVLPGETLSGIAAKYLGSAKAWPRLIDANRDLLTSPERLKAGMTLTIPERAAPPAAGS